MKFFNKNRFWKIINIIQKSFFINSKIRRHILKISGCDISSSAILAGNIFIGSNKIKIHENVFINMSCFFDGSAMIEVHSFARIGPFVKIITGTHEIQNNEIRINPSDKVICKPVVIGHGCWIGAGSIIGPGVHLADGCVVAMGSIVNKSTKKNGLYAGVPARRIKDLPVDVL